MDRGDVLQCRAWVARDRKGPPMDEQHSDSPAAPQRDTVADKADDVLGNLTGGSEEHPVESHADEAQRATPPDQGNGKGSADPAKMGTEAHDDAGDDEAVDDGSLLGVGTHDNATDNASDDAHGIIGEDA